MSPSRPPLGITRVVSGMFGPPGVPGPPGVFGPPGVPSPPGNRLVFSSTAPAASMTNGDTAPVPAPQPAVCHSCGVIVLPPSVQGATLYAISEPAPAPALLSILANQPTLPLRGLSMRVSMPPVPIDLLTSDRSRRGLPVATFTPLWTPASTPDSIAQYLPNLFAACFAANKAPLAARAPLRAPTPGSAAKAPPVPKLPYCA